MEDLIIEVIYNTHLTFNFLSGKRFLLDHHPKTDESHYHSVTAIAEHDRKQKRKRYDGIWRRIHFPIRSDTVRIDQILEGVRKLIRMIVSRRIFASFHFIQNRRHGTSTSLLYHREQFNLNLASRLYINSQRDLQLTVPRLRANWIFSKSKTGTQHSAIRHF